MEIVPVPHRASARERRRLLVGLLVLIPVAVLLLLPAVLGLNRSVVTDSSMGESLGRGDVVLARDVPTGDLRPGDVITFQRPAGNGMVTHRIIAIHDGVALTRGDAAPVDDPWRLRLDAATYPRVAMRVPWIGYPFVVDGGRVALLAGSLLALVLALGAVVSGHRPGRVPWPSPTQRRTARATAG